MREGPEGGGVRDEGRRHALVVAVRRSVMVGAVMLLPIGILLADWDPWNLVIFEWVLWDVFVRPFWVVALAVTLAVLECALSFRHRFVRRLSCAVLAFICLVGGPAATLFWLMGPRAGIDYYSEEALAVSPDGRVYAIAVAEVPYRGSTDVYFHVGLYTTAGLDRATVVRGWPYFSVWEVEALDLHFTDNRTLRIGARRKGFKNDDFIWVRFDKNLNLKDARYKDGYCTSAAVGAGSHHPQSHTNPAQSTIG
ncbi:hypothetical protein [Embleya sp. NPDC001921]